MEKRTALAALALASIAGCSAPPGVEPIERLTEPIVGGVETPACAWPTAAAFSSGSLCTATLIHPKVITLAKHCLAGNGGSVAFTDALSGGIPRTVSADHCISPPDGADFAVCVLAQEIDDVPVIPVLFGCETDILKPGQEVALVGFGEIDAGTPNPNGHKRWVTANVDSISSDRKTITIGDPTHTTCFGDSGGPAFVKLADGTWRVFGALSGANPPACASPASYIFTPTYVPWIEQQTGIDVTPCFNGATGVWEGGPTCQGFPMNPEVALGTWANGCTENLIRGGPSSTCGPPTDAGLPLRDAQADTGNDAAGGAGEAGVPEMDGATSGASSGGAASGSSSGASGTNSSSGSLESGTTAAGGDAGGGGCSSSLATRNGLGVAPWSALLGLCGLALRRRRRRATGPVT